MSQSSRKWEKLDNTAHLFPVIATDQMTNTYRISASLWEIVDGDLLQQAVDLVTPKFPGFDVRMRTGFFWYYLEQNGKPAPRVVEERTYPCRLIHPSTNNSYLFRVTYYRDRINLEVFHALADGMGGIGFLREIVYQYLRLSHPALREQLGDGLSEDTSLDREDSFIRNYHKPHTSNYKSGRAFLLRGHKLPLDGFGVVHGFMEVADLKKASRGIYGISINEYLIAAFVWAVYQERYHALMKSHRPIRVAVPVNLRPFFASDTTKNFFVMVSAEFLPQKDEYTFAEICALIHESLASQITKENLEAIFSYNVSNQQYLIARAVPLPIKNAALRVVYNRSALANTTTITNIGDIKVEKPYEDYIRMFTSFLSFSKGQGLKGNISSYRGTLCLSLSSQWEGTEIQKQIFRQIARDGVPVTVETNGVS